MDNVLIILAGPTGNLGGRVCHALLERGAGVLAIVRRGSAKDGVEALRRRGAVIAEVDYTDATELSAAWAGGSCVVSTVSGLHDVIVDAQTLLLDAAVKAGVPRFIPSDFCIDFTTPPAGTNRNLHLPRELPTRPDEVPPAPTALLPGTHIGKRRITRLPVRSSCGFRFMTFRQIMRWRSNRSIGIVLSRIAQRDTTTICGISRIVGRMLRSF